MIFSFILLLLPGITFATNVYMAPNSLYASGQYSRELLERKTVRVEPQAWVQVKWSQKVPERADGSNEISYIGWMARENIVTLSDLTESAITTQDVPLRHEPRTNASFSQSARTGEEFIRVRQQGHWTQVKPKISATGSGNRMGAEKNPWARERFWIPTVFLTAPSETVESAKLAFVNQNTKLYQARRSSGPMIKKLSRGEYVLLLKENPAHARFGDDSSVAWSSVLSTQSKLAQSGFVKLGTLVLPSHVTASIGVSVAKDLPLKALPTPAADIIARVPIGTRLEVLSSKINRWGLARLERDEPVWWLMETRDSASERAAQGLANTRGKSNVNTNQSGGVESTDQDDSTPQQLSNEDLFSRKVFDMAASPLIPNLKFASARGLFRTVDGNKWTPLETFHSENHAIAIAKHGAVFVGPYVSFDHGETFKEYIRLTNLISLLRHKGLSTPSSFKILDIKPLDAVGNSLRLRADLGYERPVYLWTDDRGLSWSMRDRNRDTDAARERDRDLASR